MSPQESFCARPSYPGQNNWVSFGQDPGGTKFSTLRKSIRRTSRILKRAWTFHTGDKSGFFESTPLVVDSVMYFSAANGVYALDAVDGTADLEIRRRPARLGRGLTYWPGYRGLPPRLFTSTQNGLAALDAKTGALVTTFGENGFIPGLRVSSPPAVYNNVLMSQGGEGFVKAWDSVTGEPRWTLNLKAQPGDPNQATWLDESWKTRTRPVCGASSPSMCSAGLLFVPVEKVGND